MYCDCIDSCLTIDFEYLLVMKSLLFSYVKNEQERPEDGTARPIMSVVFLVGVHRYIS